MTSSVPAGDCLVIPVRFRIFPNYDPGNYGGRVNEVQPGLQRASMYQNFRRGFFTRESRSIWRYPPAWSSGYFPAGTCPYPKAHPHPISVFVTSLNMTSFILVGDRPVIPDRFRIFPNYDPWIMGVGEMRYNRVRSRLRCTRISAGFFTRNSRSIWRYHPARTTGARKTGGWDPDLHVKCPVCQKELFQKTP